MKISFDTILLHFPNQFLKQCISCYDVRYSKYAYDVRDCSDTTHAMHLMDFNELEIL